MNFENARLLDGILYVKYKGKETEVGHLVSDPLEENKVFMINQSHLNFNAMDTMDLDKLIKRLFGDNARVIFQ